MALCNTSLSDRNVMVLKILKIILSIFGFDQAQFFLKLRPCNFFGGSVAPAF